MTPLNTVLVFRGELLPASETFIVEQTRAMQVFNPVLAGIRRLQNGIPLHHLTTISFAGYENTFKEKLRRRIFYETCWGTRFLKNLARQSPGLIHAHFALDACLALPIRKHLGVPLIVTLHGYDVTRHDKHFRQSALGRIYLRRRRELWQQASLFVCVSEFIRNKAIERGFPKEKLWVHRVGVDLGKFQFCLAEPRLQPIVLFVGRLVENKGCVHLIRAMAAVQERCPGAKLVVVGDGPLRAALEAEARSRLRQWTFTGTESHGEVRRWMQRASVLVMPSVETGSGDSEGLGMIMCEAQALGLPGIAFRGTGAEEALAYGESGLLVNPGDESALAEVIVLVLSDAALRSRLAEAGRRHAEACFDLHRQTFLLEEKYVEVLTGP